MFTTDQIKKAAASIRAQRPAYTELLDFYEELFLAQEGAKARLTPEPVVLSKQVLAIKQKEGFPLIGKTEFPIDAPVSEALLREICRFAGKANKALAQASLKLAENMDKKDLDIPNLFSKLLAEDDTFFKDLSEELLVDKNILAFLTYSSIRPSLVACAEQMAGHLNVEKLWEKGYCPVCGSLPALSVLRDEGARSLVCGFCGHEWKTLRIYCPFCGNQNQKTLDYFFSEEEKHYRVYVCHQCNKYLKTVDTRNMSYPFYPPVEQISTLHLDVMAREHGLESGTPLWLQI